MKKELLFFGGLALMFGAVGGADTGAMRMAMTVALMLVGLGMMALAMRGAEK